MQQSLATLEEEIALPGPQLVLSGSGRGIALPHACLWRLPFWVSQRQLALTQHQEAEMVMGTGQGWGCSRAGHGQRHLPLPADNLMLSGR